MKADFVIPKNQNLAGIEVDVRAVVPDSPHAAPPAVKGRTRPLLPGDD